MFPHEFGPGLLPVCCQPDALKQGGDIADDVAVLFLDVLTELVIRQEIGRGLPGNVFHLTIDPSVRAAFRDPTVVIEYG